MQQAFSGIEIGGRNRCHQIFYLLRMQGGIDYTERAPHADAHEIDLVRPGPLSDTVDHAVHVSVHMGGAQRDHRRAGAAASGDLRETAGQAKTEPEG